jgi:hypothetical protein
MFCAGGRKGAMHGSSQSEYAQQQQPRVGLTLPLQPADDGKVVEIYRFVHNWMSDHKTKGPRRWDWAWQGERSTRRTYSPEKKTTTEEDLRRLHHLL